MNLDLILLIGGLILAFLVGISAIKWALTAYIRKQTALVQSQKKRILLQIKVTKNSETGPIAAEQMLAAIHGIYEQKTFGQRLRGDGPQEHISLEIASIRNNIYFYVQIPEHLRDFIENQFYAQYPRVEIHEVEDYATVPSEHTKHADLIELNLVKNEVIPIKKYGEFVDEASGQRHDPLSAITATLNKIDDPHDQVWLQILARPVGDEWQKLGEKWIDAVRAGQDPEKPPSKILKLLKIVFFPLYIIKFLFRGSPEGGGEDDGRKELSDTIQKQNIAILEKSNKLGYKVKIRALYWSPQAIPTSAKSKLRAVASSFKQFNQTNLNGFKTSSPKTGRFIKKGLSKKAKLQLFKDRQFADGDGFILNIEELATIYHQPNELVRTPNIVWVTSKKEEAPSNLPLEGEEGVTTLGVTNFRNLRKRFGVRLKDRKRHIYILGKTGMGKTTLLGNMIYADIHAGKGLAYIDPHGDMAEEILSYIPSWRTNDVIYFNPADVDHPIGFNLFELRNEGQKSLVVDSVVSVFKKQFGDSWGPRMEWVLMNTISALLDTPGTTLLGILRMYTDPVFRERIVKNVKDPVAKDYWNNEFPNYNPREVPTIVGPIQNKVGQFLSSPMMRNMLGQPKSSLSIRDAMDQGKIIICNLSRGLLGENNMGLLGSMLVNKFQLDAMSRAELPEKERRDFFLYVDEFQNFSTEAFAVILSEARKYALALTVANQYIGQMTDEVRESVFGNVGSLITFQVGAEDAEFMSKQFLEQVLPADMGDLGVGEIYVKMLVDMMPTTVFSAKTVWEPGKEKYTDQIGKVLRISRERYSQPREVIEDKIRRWAANTEEVRAAMQANKGNKKKKGNWNPTPQKISSPPDPGVAEQLKKRFGYDPSKFPDVPQPTSFGNPKPGDKSKSQK